MDRLGAPLARLKVASQRRRFGRVIEIPEVPLGQIAKLCGSLGRMTGGEHRGRKPGDRGGQHRYKNPRWQWPGPSVGSRKGPRKAHLRRLVALKMTVQQ